MVDEAKAQRACDNAREQAARLADLFHSLGDSHFEGSITMLLWDKIQEQVDQVDLAMQRVEDLVIPTMPPDVPAPPASDVVPVSDTPPAPIPAPSANPTPPPVTPPTPIQGEADFEKPIWLGSWYDNIWSAVNQAVAKAKGESVFIPYNIPGRDGDGYSKGGLHSPDEYYSWTGAIADAIGLARATVILEPDALGLSGRLDGQALVDRFAMLQGAVSAYGAYPNIKIYLDASFWIAAEEMAHMLLRFQGLDGFACNVSGYDSLEVIQPWAERVSNMTGLHYIVDTSRNGKGHPHAPAWCNVTDTQVGVAATRATNSRNCDAYMWLKVPGESDGDDINGDGSHHRSDVPQAGELFPEYKEAIYSGNWDAFKAKFHV